MACILTQTTKGSQGESHLLVSCTMIVLNYSHVEIMKNFDCPSKNRRDAFNARRRAEAIESAPETGVRTDDIASIVHGQC